MSDRVKEIETLTVVFKKAKQASRDEDGWFDDLDLHDELRSALFNVGDKKYFELKDELYSYLKDPFPDFRSEAVQALGWDTGLNIRGFQKNEAYEIWLNDPSEDVRRVALVAWSRYYAYSKNPVILKNLYNIFSSEQNSISIRVYALVNFIYVADAESYLGESRLILGLAELEDQKALTLAMDWGKIYRLMQQYVPGWKK